MAGTCRVGCQRYAYDFDGVAPPGQAPVRQQHRRDSTSLAAGPSRSLPSQLAAQASQRARTRMSPRRKRGPTATQQPASSQCRLDRRRIVAHHLRHAQILVPRVASSLNRIAGARGNSCCTLTAAGGLTQLRSGADDRRRSDQQPGRTGGAIADEHHPCSPSMSPQQPLVLNQHGAQHRLTTVGSSLCCYRLRGRRVRSRVARQQ